MKLGEALTVRQKKHRFNGLGLYRNKLLFSCQRTYCSGWRHWSISFPEAINHRGLEQLRFFFENLHKKALGVLPKEHAQLGERISIDGSLIDAVLSMVLGRLWKRCEKMPKFIVDWISSMAFQAKYFLRTATVRPRITDSSLVAGKKELWRKTKMVKLSDSILIMKDEQNSRPQHTVNADVASIPLISDGPLTTGPITGYGERVLKKSRTESGKSLNLIARTMWLPCSVGAISAGR